MPTPPIVESIAQDIESSLRQINPANGYYNAVASVDRRSLLGSVPGDLKLTVQALAAKAMIDGEADRVSCGEVRWAQQFQISACVIEPADSGVPVEQRVLTIFADIVRCLCTDANAANTRGGYAEDTVPFEFIPFNTDQAELAGCDVVVTVYYHHLWGAPDSQ